MGEAGPGPDIARPRARASDARPRARTDDVRDLPRVVPIFPLPGVLLLPRGRLPLNIFEKRYLRMVQDAMGSHRTIGMVQPTDPKADPAAPEVYPTGCLGRIVSFSETPDNRFLITLAGVCRFEIAGELEAEGLLYRRVRVDYRRFAGDLPEAAPLAIDRGRLVPALKSYFERHGLAVNWDAIDRAGDEALITGLAMACPFAPNEKQALLECRGEAERVRMIEALLRMAVHEPDRPPPRVQ